MNFFLEKNNLASIQKGLLFFVLIISGNFIGELLSCRTQKLFKNSMLIKHVIAFVSLYFFVIISDDQLSAYNPAYTLLGAIIIYMYFLCFVKSEAKYFLLIVIILTVVAFLQLYDRYLEKKSNKELGRYEIKLKENISLIQMILVAINIFISIFGMLIYMGMKKLEYQNEFTYYNFFLGSPKCKDNLLGDKIPKEFHLEKYKEHAFNFENLKLFLKTALYN